MTFRFNSLQCKKKKKFKKFEVQRAEYILDLGKGRVNSSRRRQTGWVMSEHLQARSEQ